MTEQQRATLHKAARGMAESLITLTSEGTPEERQQAVENMTQRLMAACGEVVADAAAELRGPRAD